MEGMALHAPQQFLQHANTPSTMLHTHATLRGPVSATDEHIQGAKHNLVALFTTMKGSQCSYAILSLDYGYIQQKAWPHYILSAMMHC